MCSICYREFMHSQKSKDSAANAASGDLRSSPAVQDGQPGKSLHQSVQQQALECAEQGQSMAMQPAIEDSALIQSEVAPQSALPASSNKAGEAVQEGLPGISQAVVKGVVRPRRIRCFACRKKVGPMGFPCRCGEVFCEQHRYPENHDCDFDHKATERQKIQDDNPVVISERVRRV